MSAENSATLVKALDGVATVTLNERIPAYDRSAFGDGWADLDGDGCNTREEILMRDLGDVVLREDRGCKVHTGVLHDPYAGATILFDSVRDPQAVQIDHVLPLSLAWRLGAWNWTPEERKRFHNDTANLLAVAGAVNSSKGDRGPARWLPDAGDFTCEYVSLFATVLTSYELGVTSADRATLQRTLSACTP